MKETRSRFASILVLLGATIIGSIIPLPLLAESFPLAVFYPAIREPYRSIFLNIIQGIEDRHSGPTYIHVVNKNYKVKKIRKKLEEERVQVVITLGSRGLLLAKQLQPWFKVVVGAVLMIPDKDGLTGISLTPDPEKLFQKIKALLPEIKNVTVIYSEGHSEGLIERARESARAHNLELNAIFANGLQHAAILYRHVLSQMKSETDSLWLPYDKIINEQVLLPLILQRAWERNLAVFSSDLDSVKRGALFTLYPNNVAMGRSLAELALKQVGDPRYSSPGIRPLRDLLGAINARTAEHLGLDLTYWQMRQFELVFPPG